MRPSTKYQANLQRKQADGMIGVSDNFHKAAFGQIIKPILKLYVSFDKSLNEGEFFTLDKSQLNGPDLLRFAGSDADTQSWDFYNYVDYSDRLVSLSWERTLQFPYQIQCGMADFTVSNTDGFFTPLNPNSPIGENNLPARPMKLAAGFEYQGNTEVIPQMAGITDGMPVTQSGSKTVDYHAIDFLYQICNQSLKTVINMRNARTDEVIAAILQSYGLAPSQYNLEPGRYRIPFVFFDVGDSIGDALKKLVQSEGGFMWLDEVGVVRFATSAMSANNIDTKAVLGSYHVMSIDTGDLSDIVNHVKITAEIREVQEYQEVYTKSDSTESVSTSLWVVPAGESITVNCSLGDPCYDVVAPTLGRASSVSWFTAITSSGAQVTRNITATGVLSSGSYAVTFTNTNTYDVEIAEMKLWGEPAKVTDVLNYDAYEDVSVEKYGDQILEITDNQFFQTYGQANAYARTLIKQHAEYNRSIKVGIKGDFALQLLDLIEINTGGDYDGIYQILGISYSYSNNRLTTYLTLNGTGIKEGVFTLNVSRLNGEDRIQ